MTPKNASFLGLMFAAGTMIGLTLGGGWLGSTDLATVSSLTVFKEANILGLFTITIPNMDFFFTGMQAVTAMDFGFFAGGLELVQFFFLYVFAFGALWGIITVVINVIASRFGR